MSYRFMRVIVFYDLPQTTKRDRKIYIKFRCFLLGMGFMMMQESVYSKLVLNPTAAKAVRENVRKCSPSDGLVQMITITERQFQNIEFVTGEAPEIVLNSDERIVFL